MRAGGLGVLLGDLVGLPKAFRPLVAFFQLSKSDLSKLKGNQSFYKHLFLLNFSACCASYNATMQLCRVRVGIPMHRNA